MNTCCLLLQIPRSIDLADLAAPTTTGTARLFGGLPHRGLFPILRLSNFCASVDLPIPPLVIRVIFLPILLGYPPDNFAYGQNLQEPSVQITLELQRIQLAKISFLQSSKICRFKTACNIFTIFRNQSCIYLFLVTGFYEAYSAFSYQQGCVLLSLQAPGVSNQHSMGQESTRCAMFTVYGL